ncbi:lysozyme [Sphingomicrobium astaxanthinifaciens]|uniref:lysozyme n=1 Tax=Sphingomicrobium astaxanthinifaciens TaxID=1227949 RepID=UPI001FCA8B22|nr:lysozyme [Sphingomicrobium astaxanthinifaciens]MCJ7421704.1 lysozyme [Sphingomicrobium astaxanthinifaciens]
MPFLGRSHLLAPLVAIFAAADEVQELEEEVDEEIGEVIDEIERFLADDLEVSDALIDAIQQEEGKVLVVYRDITGLPTVGAGHLVRPEDNLRVGDRITEAQMREFLRNDLREAEDAVRKIAKATPLSQNEFDALVDLVYNVGPGNVSPTKSPRLNEALQKRDYKAAAEQLHYSKARDGRRAGGLVNRSERRRRIFEKGDYGDPREG